MSIALALFTALCDVGTAIEQWRDRYEVASDEWTALTDLLGRLDAAIDMLVESSGLRGDDDADHAG